LTLTTIDNTSPRSQGRSGELAIEARLDELADLIWFRDNPETRSIVRTLTDRELAVAGISPDARRPLIAITLIDGELWRRAIPFVTAPLQAFGPQGQAEGVRGVVRVPVTQEAALEIATWAQQMTDLVILPMPSTAIH
jgi:hypothetical protein